MTHDFSIMSNSKLGLKTPDEAEAAFYEAFRQCDAKAMAALWANGEVVCIHPGSGGIVGHEAVVRSWSHIFGNARPPNITCTVSKRIVTDKLAVSLVLENVSGNDGATALVLATNVYQRFDAGWLMVEHHGSLVQSRSRSQTLQ